MRDEVLRLARIRQVEEETEQEEEGRAGYAPVSDAPVKRKHVLGAARETEGALQKQKSRTRAEIVQFFDELDGIAYGYEDGPVRLFLNYFVNTWCPGGGSDKTLMVKFDAMTDRAAKGTKPPAEGKANSKASNKTTKTTKARKKK